MDEKMNFEKIWDDRILIKSYQNSARLANEELAKLIASSTNNQKEDGKFEIIENENEEVVYKVGDYARATYEDGCDYEGKIIKIGDDGTCEIKYIGYDNLQVVKISELLPSWGKKARRAQFATAKKEQEPKNKKSTNKSQTNIPNIFENSSIPPPPPIPPAMLLGCSGSEDYEYFTSMLMSWYMSGYYTGVYQGMKMKSKPKTK